MKTNYEYLHGCSKADLADSLTIMIVTTIEQITGKAISNELYVAEYKSILKYLDSECYEVDGYLN